MNISELSIRRPVLSTVLTLIILLFGLIGYSYLGVREYPSVDNPIISVSCSYPGANADVIENQITEPLEQNINGIPGIRSLSSVSQQGSSRITVEFELSVDLETAANDVRDKVSRAQRYLPRDCDPPTVSKADADATPILMVALQSDKRSLLELSEIADLTVKEQLQTISDVSSVSIWGEKRYSMRLWLDPIKMSGYGITPIDVKNAVDKENVELPSGSIEGNTVELTIRTLGLMHTAEEFNNLILREDNNRIIRFSDIGRAELGPADIKSYMKMNGVPMVGIVVVPQPGANHIKIADAVYERMEQLPLAEDRIPKQRIHHNADAGRKPQERLQCGLRYADAGRSDLHTAHRDHLPLPAEELCQRHHGCSQVMDERTYCLTPEQWRHAKACLTLAKRWGLIGDDSPEALERRRAAKNAQAEKAEQDGKPVYGTRRFSAPAYLQYELTRFKLDFAEPCEKIRALGICPDFTDAQTRAWYDTNPDLFTRYAGDSFPYEEVKQIIEKRMREEVYDSLVQDLLRGPADRP